MATVDVLNWKKEKVGSVDLKDEVFGAELRNDLLHLVVRWQLAKRRQGTHQVKTRSTINGTGKKPFKQKGTGNARQGNRRSPLLEGGSVIHGPSPRDYSFKLTKKTRQAGLRVALSHLLREGRLMVVDSIESADGKTKDMMQKFNGLGLNKAVIVSSESEEKVSRATRNLKTFRYYGVEGLNVYDLLKYDTAVITKDSLAKIEQKCGVDA